MSDSGIDTTHTTTLYCRLAGTKTHRRFAFSCPADVTTARQWGLAYRRIHRVDLRLTGGEWHGEVSATRHRRPITRRVPLAVALGFANLGANAVVHGVR